MGWLRRYIASASGPWKAACCFCIAGFGLIVLVGVATLAGWNDAAHRLFAYLCLATVGMFFSLIIHAYLSIRASRQFKIQQRQREHLLRRDS